MFSPTSKFAKARHIYREQGRHAVVALVRGYVRTRLGLPAESDRRRRKALAGAMPLPKHMTNAVLEREVLDADWTTPRTWRARRTGDTMTLNWVIPIANPGSGGHQNIFRFISHLEQRGHTCRIYVHDPHALRSHAMHERMIREHFVHMDAEVLMVDGELLPADGIVATSWPTAYPVFNDPSDAPRFYFVQDFEPLFYPLGTEYVLAENTYRFGFHGITAGAWLSSRLERDYGMRCDHYEFGAEPDLYSLTNTGERNAVLFYARPPTPRRAFELGVLTLSLFAQQHPDVEIHMAGWPLTGFKPGFDFVDHGVLRLEELNGLYNQLSAALVLSLTNCSLLPLELLAAGAIPVVNDAPNNRMVVDNPNVRYCPPSPHALAAALGEACTAPDRPALSRQASESVRASRWDDACAKVEQVLLEAVRA